MGAVYSLDSFRVLKTTKTLFMHLLFPVSLYGDWKNPDNVFISPNLLPALYLSEEDIV